MQAAKRTPDLSRAEILARLSGHSQDIRERFKMTSLEVFGSVARNTSHSSSDLDILVEFAEPVGLFHSFALQDYLESL